MAGKPTAIVNVNGRTESNVEARRLLRDPQIFGQFLEALSTSGLVGEQRNALVLLVVVVSRLLDRPLSAIVRGPSSGGKNCLVKSILAFLPEDAIRELSSASSKSWAYAENEFSHRVVSLQERNELSGGVEPLRALISEGRIEHYVTEYVEGKRTLVKHTSKGPVAGISTTNRGLEIDDATRHVLLWVDESADQTSRIVKAYHRRAQGLAESDKALWLQGQALLGERAKGLGNGAGIVFPEWFDRVPDEAFVADLTVRRYYPAFVEGCRAVCLLRSFQDGRKSTDNTIVVNFADFAIASIILEEAFVESLHRQEGSPLEVAEAARQISSRRSSERFDEKDLAEEMRVSRSTASRRIHEAIDSGAIEQIAKEENNHKFFRVKPKPRFTPDPKTVFQRANELGDSVRFIHPLTGREITYTRKKLKTKKSA